MKSTVEIATCRERQKGNLTGADASVKRNRLLVGGFADTPVDLGPGGNSDGTRPCLGNGGGMTSDKNTWLPEADTSAKRNLLFVGGCTDTPVDLVVGGNVDGKHPCLEPTIDLEIV